MRAEKPARSAPSRTLLIADDEPSVRELVRMTLLDERYEILEAVDGVETLEVARAKAPAMILLDVAMPGASGLDVCRALKADPATAHIVVVMLTAHIHPDSLSDAMEAGADAYFTKPFSPLMLLRKVDEVFASLDAEHARAGER